MTYRASSGMGSAWRLRVAWLALFWLVDGLENSNAGELWLAFSAAVAIVREELSHELMLSGKAIFGYHKQPFKGHQLRRPI